MMKVGIAVMAAVLMSSCVNFYAVEKRSARFEDRFSGEHSALAECVAIRLQSDGRSFLRPLQFRIRQYPDIHSSEIHAYDTRYLQNAYSTYAPSNPDAILIYGNPVPEILSATQRNPNDKSVYAFALMLQQSDDTTVNASLRGDPFMGNIAWKILQSCVASMTGPE
jgi:hypothetical protein